MFLREVVTLIYIFNELVDLDYEFSLSTYSQPLTSHWMSHLDHFYDWLRIYIYIFFKDSVPLGTKCAITRLYHYTGFECHGIEM